MKLLKHEFLLNLMITVVGLGVFGNLLFGFLGLIYGSLLGLVLVFLENKLCNITVKK